LGASVF